VIAILSLLLALTVNGLGSARQAVKRLACQSNLRQLAIAWTDYLDANDGYFLKSINMNSNYGGKQGAIRPFQKSKPLNMYVQLPDVVYEGAEVFMCPSDRGSRLVQPSYFDYMGTSYQMNPMLVGQSRVFVPKTDPCAELRGRLNKQLRMVNRSRAGNPSKLLLMGDYGWVAESVAWSDDRIEWHDAVATHNIAFLDGHVDFVRIDKGLHATQNYNLYPFKGLETEFLACQERPGDEK
jgi:prepilin-type processing-associated H-X9-DG protein